MTRLRIAVDEAASLLPAGAAVLDRLRQLSIEVRTALLMLHRRPSPGDAIPYLHMETTNICNANCVFCAYQHQKTYRKAGIMPQNLFESVLSDYRNLGGHWIDFTPMVGEPLVDPLLPSRLLKAKELGFQTAFTTNASLLCGADIELIIRASPVVVAVSTAPLDKNLYTRIYRNSLYDNMLAGLETYLTARNKANSSTVVALKFRGPWPPHRCMRTNDFKTRILPLLRTEDLDAIECLSTAFDNWGGLIRQTDLVSGMRLASSPVLKCRPCRALKTIMVSHNGLVRACSCRFTSESRDFSDGCDELVVGNLASRPLSDIIRGQEYARVYASFGRGQLPQVCRRCSLYRPM